MYDTHISIDDLSRTSNENPKRKDNQANAETCENDSSNKKIRKRKRRFMANIVNSVQQLDGHLMCVQVPDCLLFQMNSISGDTGSSRRLFTSILSTKDSFLNLITTDKYIVNSTYEPIKVRNILKIIRISHTINSIKQTFFSFWTTCYMTFPAKITIKCQSICLWNVYRFVKMAQDSLAIVSELDQLMSNTMKSNYALDMKMNMNMNFK